MTYRPFFLYGDTATPPETDDPPVLCVACGRAECGCGQDPEPALDSPPPLRKIALARKPEGPDEAA